MEQARPERHHRHQSRLRHGHRRGRPCGSAGTAGQRSGDPDALLARLGTRVARIVSYGDWATIDAAEKRRGALGKPREKFVSVPDMLAATDA